MKSAIFAIALGLSATSVVAQIPGLPTCASECLAKGLASTGCGLVDFKCSCSNPEFISESRTCIAGACSEEDSAMALEVAAALCESVGAPLPETPEEPETPVTTTSVVTEPTYPTVTETTAVPTTIMTTPVGTGTGSPSPTSNQTQPTNTATPPPPDTGAASKVGVSLGALGLAIAALMMM